MRGARYSAPVLVTTASLRRAILGRMTSRALPFLLLAAALTATPGCGSDADDDGARPTTSSGAGANGGSGAAGGGGGGGADGGSAGDGPIGGDRPVEVFVPSSYEEGTPTALVLLLHGYTASRNQQELYFQIEPQAEARGFLYAHPDGTKDTGGSQFWNATDACCDLYNSGVDDSGYLAMVIEQIKAKYTVDAKRVFLAGHSNGGFMSYRM